MVIFQDRPNRRVSTVALPEFLANFPFGVANPPNGALTAMVDGQQVLLVLVMATPVYDSTADQLNLTVASLLTFDGFKGLPELLVVNDTDAVTTDAEWEALEGKTLTGVSLFMCVLLPFTALCFFVKSKLSYTANNECHNFSLGVSLSSMASVTPFCPARTINPVFMPSDRIYSSILQVAATRLGCHESAPNACCVSTVLLLD